MKKILYLALAALIATMSSCKEDYLETSSSSVVDRQFVFSNPESARAALYFGYQDFKNNGNVHSVGLFWAPVHGSDIEDAQDTYSATDPTTCTPAERPPSTSTRAKAPTCSASSTRRSRSPTRSSPPTRNSATSPKS